jgi:hypothetical protein
MDHDSEYTMQLIRRIAAILSLAAVTACSDAGTGTETPRAVVTSGPTSIELIPGGSKYIVYSVERVAGHTGAVQLSVTGVPEGVLARFHPPVVTNGALVSSLEVTVSPTAASGTHTFTTVATGAGVQTTSIPVTVTIVVPGVALSVATPSLSMQQGTSATTTLTLARSGGFAGVTGLTLSGVPAGVSATLSSIALAGGEATTTLTTAAALDAPVGTFALTITAAAPGITARSITIPVTVSAGTKPAVLLSATPAALAMSRGSTSQVPLSIARFAGYNGVVSIAVEGLPANVTATVAPIAVGQTTTTLVLTAGSNAVAPQVSTLTLRATGAGIADATLPFTLNVLEAPTFRFNFNRLGPNGPFVGSLGVEVARNSSVFVGGTIERISGFSEPVTVSVIGAPSGLAFSSFILGENLPALFPASSATSQSMSLYVNVAANAVPGTYHMTMRGVAASGLLVEAPVVVVVQ